MTEINLDLETLYTELRQNISFIVLSNGYLMQKPVMIYKSEVEKLGGVMNAHVIYNTIYKDYGDYKPDNIAMRNIKDRHDSWMWKLFPKEDREPNIHQYSPTLVLAPQPNFGLEIRVRT
ncbi:MAG: hypothetical protein F6K24_12195 [Okeania sp. SIO2D1]|nr:hypothetical protein [Okeania sp. SIO2D1]